MAEFFFIPHFVVQWQNQTRTFKEPEVGLKMSLHALQIHGPTSHSLKMEDLSNENKFQIVMFTFFLLSAGKGIPCE